jgi:uncharacterized membrane protein (GlpM family)
MDQLFLIQLLSSFFLGGLIVALQAWLAQKVPHKISGLIISAPSTIVVNFFFLGLVLTQDEFSKVLPMIPAPLGISFVLIISYIISANFFSKFIKSKLLSIVISFSISLLIWFLSAFPLVTLRGLDLSLSMIIYVSLVLLFQFFIIQLQEPKIVINKISVTNFQILTRAIFSGLMVTLTVFFAKISGPNIGALLSMFPTAYLCLLIIIHYSSGPKCLSNYFANSALGSLSLIIYANCAHYFFPKYGISLGSILCFILSAFSSFLLVKFESNFKIFGNNSSTRN